MTTTLVFVYCSQSDSVARHWTRPLKSTGLHVSHSNRWAQPINPSKPCDPLAIPILEALHYAVHTLRWSPYMYCLVASTAIATAKQRTVCGCKKEGSNQHEASIQARVSCPTRQSLSSFAGCRDIRSPESSRHTTSRVASFSFAWQTNLVRKKRTSICHPDQRRFIQVTSTRHSGHFSFLFFPVLDRFDAAGHTSRYQIHFQSFNLDLPTSNPPEAPTPHSKK